MDGALLGDCGDSGPVPSVGGSVAGSVENPVAGLDADPCDLAAPAPGGDAPGPHAVAVSTEASVMHCSQRRRIISNHPQD